MLPMPRRQPANNKEKINQEIEIARHGLAIDAQAAGQRRGVELCCLVVGEHRPKTPQCFSGNAWPELWNVALQIRANEILPPFKTVRVIACKKTGRKPTARP